MKLTPAQCRKVSLSQEEMREALEYNPETGVFVWKKPNKMARSIKPGSIAGYYSAGGYRQIKISGRQYFEHRLAWLYVFGRWPEGEIDHLNHRRSDNRITNLREVSKSENRKNKALYKNNSSGISGVYWDAAKNKWCAQIQGSRANKVCLGVFSNKIDAIQARKKAEREHGYHANNGKRALAGL